MLGWLKRLFRREPPKTERRFGKRRKGDRRWAGQFKPRKDPRRRKERRKRNRGSDGI